MPVNDVNTTFKEFKKTERLMGNSFEITVVADDERWAFEKIGMAIAEIRRIEKLLTTFDENSQTNLINKNAGGCEVKVDKEVFDLIQRSLRISAITDGAFDITYGSLDKRLWNFDRTMTKLPSAATARSMVKLINYQNVILNSEDVTVRLKQKGMRIGFGGIGKGYAAEMAKQLLKNEGVVSGIVNASGDMTTWGTQASGRKWTIGIANPDHALQPFSYMNITDMAVATSGNYEKYVIIDGKRYSHTINPKTGLPVTGIKSVTIICPNAELADAMATPVTIMGVRAGIRLVDQIQQMGCIIVDDDNNIHSSNNIHLQ